MSTGYGYAPYGYYPYGYPSPPTVRIQDVARNPLASPATGQMLGWIEPTPVEEELQLDIYRFILSAIRNEDIKTLFLKRFVEGQQQVWRTTQSKIFDIKSLISLTEIRDEYLRYIQGQFGWVGKLEKITEQLDDDTLRRLLAISHDVWKNLGPEDTLLDLLNFTTGARSRIWNWFDYRWVLDETQLGEDHQGRDSWIIDLPLEGNDEYYSNLRIVDDGSLNRTLVKELVKLVRPSGERYEISYIDFLDLFTFDNDDGQWQTILGNLEISNGTAKLEDDTTTEGIIAHPVDPAWSNYVCYWRIKGTSTYTISGPDKAFFAIFYTSDDGLDGYFVEVFPAENKFAVGKYSGGVFDTYFQQRIVTLYDDVWYGIRVQISPEGTASRIKVYLDDDEILNTLDDSTRSGGSIGIAHIDGATIECSEVEMFQLPLESDLIDINP